MSKMTPKQEKILKQFLAEREKVSPPTTQHDMTTAGQRRINLIWEVTQGLIAIVTTGAMIYCSVNKIVSQELTNAFFLIVGFYFSRTNHAQIGGVGTKATDTQEYKGR
jgi:hypothetical protein